MKHEENTKLYEADEGKFIVRIADGKIMGDGLYLGVSDSISNYREDPYTEESRKEFFESIGKPDPKIKPERPNKNKTESSTEENNQ